MRVIGLAAVLALSTGCMTLDWAAFNPTKTKEYKLEFEQVPPEQVELVSFENSDGLLLYGVWAHHEQPAPPLIYFHGNAANIDSYLDRVEYYWAWGYDVFIVDYRGFGRSEGEPTVDGVMETDGYDTVQYVLDTTSAQPEDILWMCESLGGSVCIHTNDEMPARALVLDSVFAAARMVGNDSIRMDVPEGWLFADTLDNVEQIPNITAPVLLVHGKNDNFIPPSHVFDLYDAAPEPKELWRPEGVAHARITRQAPEEYEQKVDAFVGGI